MLRPQSSRFGTWQADCTRLTDVLLANWCGRRMRKSSAETQPLSVRPTRSNRACGHPRAGTSRARARGRERETRRTRALGVAQRTPHAARSTPHTMGRPDMSGNANANAMARYASAGARQCCGSRTHASLRALARDSGAARSWFARARRALARAARSAIYGGTHRHGSAGRDAQPMPSTHTLAPTVDTRPLAHDRRARSAAGTRPSRPTGARTSAMLRMTHGRFLPVRLHARTRTRLQHTIAAATYARRC